MVLPFGGSGRKHIGGASLSEVLEAFHRERTAGGRTLAQKTLNEHRVAVRMFEEFMGGPVTTQAITKADILAYKAALLETPAPSDEPVYGQLKVLPDDYVSVCAAHICGRRQLLILGIDQRWAVRQVAGS